VAFSKDYNFKGRMKITKYIHSFIMVEEGKNRVLVDPGPFSFIEESVRTDQFEGIKAIFITHKHADHYDPVAIKRIAKNNPGMKVFCNSETAEVLEEVKIGQKFLRRAEEKLEGLELPLFLPSMSHFPMRCHLTPLFCLTILSCIREIHLIR